MKFKISNWNELKRAIDRGDSVYMYNAGPMSNKKVRVIDYVVSRKSYPDDDWLDEEGFADKREWYNTYCGCKAIVTDGPISQTGTNTRILDNVDVEDFDIYCISDLVENRVSRKNNLKRSQKSFSESKKIKKSKSLKEMKIPYEPEADLSVIALKTALLEKNPALSTIEELSQGGAFFFSWKGEICGSVVATPAGYVLSGPDENYVFIGKNLASFDKDLDCVIQDCRAYISESKRNTSCYRK